MTSLAACRIMVVEDSFVLAMEVKSALEGAGAEVIGPFAGSEGALKALRRRAPDCAVLDVNLGEGASFAVAETLRRDGIPFLFLTGYDRSALPPEFANVDRLEKPVKAIHLIQAVQRCCRPAPWTG